MLTAQAFVGPPVVDLPTVQVLSQHLCFQSWPESERTTSGDMITQHAVIIKIGDLAIYDFSTLSIVNDIYREKNSGLSALQECTIQALNIAELLGVMYP